MAASPRATPPKAEGPSAPATRSTLDATGPAPLPRLLVIGTGGTIAGASPAGDPGRYRAGAIGIDSLVGAAPGLAGRFDIRGEQPFSIGSQHFDSGHWLALAHRIAAANDDASIDGIVVTHGTDTLEETAFALDLLCRRAKPVVLTGAMRPATAPGADGPANLAAACRVAADPAAAGRGAVVVFADRVWPAPWVGKRQTTLCDAFDAGSHGADATITGAGVHWRLPQPVAATLASARPSFAGRVDLEAVALPPVSLVWQYVDADPALIDWQVKRGVRGLVLAATGAGTMPVAVRAALARAVDAGCVVVRASRVADGPVIRDNEVDPAERDSALGFIAAGSLGPLKARILVQTALAAGIAPTDGGRLQALFDDFG